MASHAGENMSISSRTQCRGAILSACIIARDNEQTISACLNGLRPWVDQLIVVDTGSVDRTIQLASEAGAEIHDFRWVDDFSAARNASLAHARGDWVFWMDTDDVIDAANGRKLRMLVDGGHDASVAGYVAQVHCPQPSVTGVENVTIVDHVKLFRNLPELRFEGRIHEQILPAIQRIGGRTAWTDIFVVHAGVDHAPAAKQRKIDRDLRILATDLIERPDHPFVLFNLGMTYSDAGRHAEACECLRRCVQVSTVGESHLRKAYAIWLQSLTALRQVDEAAEVCARGRKLFPVDPELLFRQGILEHQASRPLEAVRCYRQLLSIRDERHFSSIDVGLTGYKTRHNLALLYEELGHADFAEAQWRAILREHPTYRPAVRALGESLVRTGRLASLEMLLDSIESHVTLAAEAFVLRGEICRLTGRIVEADEFFSAGCARFPEHLPLLQSRGRFLFKTEAWVAAKAVLTRVLELDPANAATLHNLGQIERRCGQHAIARELLQESLRLRPDAPQTAQALAEVEADLIASAAPPIPSLLPLPLEDTHVNGNA